MHVYRERRDGTVTSRGARPRGLHRGPLPTHSGIGLLLAAALTLVGAGPLAAQQRVDETRPAAPDGVVEIRNVAGSVEVSGWDREEVRVAGTLEEDVEELTVDRSGRRTRIEVRLPEDGHGREADADLTIRVPRGSDVTVSTVSAGIDVADVDGDLDLSSVSGGVEVGSGAGPVRAESISGTVRVEGGRDEVRARSTSGRVEVRGVRGTVEAASVSGPVDVSGSTLREVQIETVSGGARLEGGLTSDATVEVETMSGSVELVFPSDVEADFELSTFSGSLSIGLDARVDRSRDWGAGQDVEFTTGDGGARVVVESFSGSITIRGS